MRSNFFKVTSKQTLAVSSATSKYKPSTALSLGVYAKMCGERAAAGRIMLFLNLISLGRARGPGARVAGCGARLGRDCAFTSDV